MEQRFAAERSPSNPYGVWGKTKFYTEDPRQLPYSVLGGHDFSMLVSACVLSVALGTGWVSLLGVKNKQQHGVSLLQQKDTHIHCSRAFL